MGPALILGALLVVGIVSVAVSSFFLAGDERRWAAQERAVERRLQRELARRRRETRRYQRSHERARSGFGPPARR